MWDVRGRLICPACGYDTDLQIPQYAEDHGLQIHICEACLWELGYDDEGAATPDEVVAVLQAYRQGWGGKAPYLAFGAPPNGSNGKQQLARLFAIAPYVQ